MASIYRRKGGVYYIKFRRGSRWIYRSLETTDQETAERFKAEFEAALDTKRRPPKPTAEGGLSVSDFESKYFAWAETHLSQSSIDNRRRALERFRECVSFEELSQVTSDDVERFKSWYFKSGKEGKGVRPRTVNEAVSCLKAMYARARRQGWYSGPNPFLGVDMLREPKRERRILTPEQMTAALEAAEMTSWNQVAVWTLGLYAGLRKNEIVNASTEWFEVYEGKRAEAQGIDGMIHVRGSDTFQTKARVDRVIPMHPKIRSLIESLGDQADRYIVAPENKPGKDRYRYNIRKGFTTVAKAAGAPWATPHTLRHTFATRALEAGVPIYTVQAWLGHSTVRTTEIYTHPTPEHALIKGL